MSGLIGDVSLAVGYQALALNGLIRHGMMMIIIISAFDRLQSQALTAIDARC